MKLKYTLILFFLLAGINVRAQNQLTGTVTMARNGHQVKSATVYIPDLKIGTTTDDNGFYIIKNIPAGTYVVSAGSIGYSTQVQTVRITRKNITTSNFVLSTATYTNDEVVVTANSIATMLRTTPQPIVDIPNSYLMQNASTNIIDALSNVPGVSGISDGQSISKPVIRGLGYNRVVVVNDGVRQEGQQWGDEFGIEVDQNSVDRVEILKGPASLIYGSDALNGVINFLPEETLPEGQIKGDLLYNYQTNNGLINTTGHIAGTIKGISFSARISNIMAHAYQNKYDGYVFNSQFSNFNWDGTIGIHRRWGFSQLHYSFFDLKTGIVEGARDSATGAFVKQNVDANGNPIYQIATNQELRSYTPFLINQHVRHYKLVWDNSIALGEDKIIARVAFQQNRRQENNDITQPNTSNIYYLLNTVNYDFRYASKTRNDFDFSAGINGMYQDSKNKGTLLLIPEYNLFDIGAFAIANKKLGKLDISGGLRYDIRRFNGHDDYVNINGNHVSANDSGAIHQFSAYTSNYNGVSGSVGATYQFTKSLYLKANIARGFRAPNVAESGSNGVHDGTVVYEVGTPGLKPENSLEFDLAPGIQTRNFSVEVDLYSNSINNYIFPRQVQSKLGGDSIRTDVPGYASAPVFLYSQGNASLTGMEAMLDIHPSGWKWFEWYSAYSGVNAYLKNVPDSAKYLPFTPPSKIISNITVSLKKKSKIVRNSYVRFGIAYTFQQSHVYYASSVYNGTTDPLLLKASNSPTPGYLLLNAGAGTDLLKKGRKMCSIYVSVNNLANLPYIDYMSRFKYYDANLANGVNRVGVYNMGRNISFKVLIPLDFRD